MILNSARCAAIYSEGNGIFTTPKLGALTPGGILYVKGEHLGTSKGKINLHLSHPVPQVVGLSVEEWSDKD